MVIHHITEKVIQDKPPFQGSEACRRLNDLVNDENSVIVAHKAQFDTEMFQRQRTRKRGILMPKRAHCFVLTFILEILMGCLISLDANADTLSGYLQHLGIPMSQYTDTAPFIWIRNEETGMTYEGAESSYDNTDGSYEIKGLSGRVGISISFHVTGSEASLPGNFRRWITLDIDELNDLSLDIEIEKIIHLIAPMDNSKFFQFAPPYPEHSPPISFRWEPVEGATQYQVHIDKYRDGNHPDGYGRIGSVANESVQGVSYIIDIDPSEQHEHYEFYIEAWGPTERVGHFMITYEGGTGWDYRFKAGPKPYQMFVDPQGNCSSLSPCYTSIGEAIDAADKDVSIKALEGSYDEELVIDDFITYRLLGGYDDAYSIQLGTSRVNAITCMKGTFEPNRIVLGK